MEDNERDLCVRGFHVYRDIYAVLERRPPYVSDLWDCSHCLRLVFFSPLPGCPSPLPALLDSPERLLELVLQTIVILLGPVSRLYAAGTAIVDLCCN